MVQLIMYSRKELEEYLTEYANRSEKPTREGFRRVDKYPAPKTIDRRFGTWGNALHECGCDVDGIINCPICGDRYMTISNHWGVECPYPEIEDDKAEILIGSVMGDGHVTTSHVNGSPEHSNPGFIMEMTNKDYLEYISDKLGWFSYGVRETDEWCLKTPRHPSLEDINWINDVGDKRYPDWLELTPIILKHWYCQDGGLVWDSGDKSAVLISCENESDRGDILDNLFSPLPMNVIVSNSGRIRVPLSDVDSFFSYIGDSPPGFDYKWCYRDKEEYSKRKSGVEMRQ